MSVLSANVYRQLGDCIANVYFSSEKECRDNFEKLPLEVQDKITLILATIPNETVTLPLNKRCAEQITSRENLQKAINTFAVQSLASFPAVEKYVVLKGYSALVRQACHNDPILKDAIFEYDEKPIVPTLPQLAWDFINYYIPIEDKSRYYPLSDLLSIPKYTPLLLHCQELTIFMHELTMWAGIDENRKTAEIRISEFITNPTASTLNLSCLGLDSLPPNLFECSQIIAKLKELDLTENNLEAIPSNIENLTHLEILYLNRNKLKQLPEGLFKIKKLEVISMLYNRDLILPMSVLEVPDGCRVHISSSSLKPIYLQDSASFSIRVDSKILDQEFYNYTYKNKVNFIVTQKI